MCRDQGSFVGLYIVERQLRVILDALDIRRPAFRGPIPLKEEQFVFRISMGIGVHDTDVIPTLF